MCVTEDRESCPESCRSRLAGDGALKITAGLKGQSPASRLLQMVHMTEDTGIAPAPVGAGLPAMVLSKSPPASRANRQQAGSYKWCI
ncbi:hypothetical protein EMIT0P44_520010 [Pseudomonas sp. IT-P44]